VINKLLQPLSTLSQATTASNVTVKFSKYKVSKGMEGGGYELFKSSLYNSPVNNDNNK
jgi:hypothetical protein